MPTSPNPCPWAAPPPTAGPVGRACSNSAWSASRSRPSPPSAAATCPPGTCSTPTAANASATPNRAPPTDPSTPPASSASTSTAPASTSASSSKSWTSCAPPRTAPCAWNASWPRRSPTRARTPAPAGAAEELRLAGLLIDAAGGAVDWGAYRDQAAQELRALIDIKLQGQPAAAPEPDHMVLPLLEALRQSVAAAAPADDGAATG